jgi:hypothetical protein
MKTSYAAPHLVRSGHVVCLTLGWGMLAPREVGPTYRPIASGTIGFYL